MNTIAILVVSTKLTEIEQVYSNHLTKEMNTIEHQKRTDFLETECARLCNLTINQHVKSSTMASNNRRTEDSYQVVLREEESVHQLRDPVEIKGQSPPHSDEGQ
jgi:hypothetical protein